MTEQLTCLADVPVDGREEITQTALATIHERAAEAMAAATAERFRVRTDQRSRNYGPNPMHDPIAGFCVHHTAGTETSDFPTLMGWTARRVSCNDYITKQGVIYEMCPHPRRAWAQGFNTKNDSSYYDDGNSAYWSTELENRGDNRDPYPQIQIDAYVWRQRQLRKRFPNVNHPDQLFRHRDYAAEKVDTSDNFPYAEVKRRIFAATDPTDGENPLPVPEPAYKPAAKYTIIRPDTRWAKARAEFFEASFPGLVDTVTDADEAMKVSRFCNDNPKLGEYVCIVMGAKVLPLVYPEARKNMLKYGRDECDTWSAVDDRRAYESFMFLARAESTSPATLIRKYEEKFRAAPKPAPVEPAPKPPAAVDLGPYRKDAIQVINRYAKEPHGQVIAEEADRAGLDLALAVALVDHESAGIQNIFGCDAGGPFCHEKVVPEKTRRLIAHVKAGGTSQGVGLTQLTWKDFLYDAEKQGGLHLPRYQCRVGFALLVQYLGNDDYLPAITAYNTGWGNRYSRINSYGATVAERHRVWKARLS